MENDSYSKVRLEDPRFATRKAFGALSGAFFGGIIACLVAGLLGPEVYERANFVMPSPSLNVTWYGQVSDMSVENQRLFLQMRLINLQPDATMSYHQEYAVATWGADEFYYSSECTYGCIDCDEAVQKGVCSELTGQVFSKKVVRCERHEDWCGWTTLLTAPFVEYSVYYMKVDMAEPELFYDVENFAIEFQIVYMSSLFTTWEMVWWYTLCGLTICFMFLPRVGFFTEMLKLPQSFWSRQQIWVALLLTALLFFNNVFFAAQIYSPAPKFFFDLYVVQLATFLCLILFFWLEIFGDMAAGEMQGTDTAQLWQRNKKKAMREMAPKFSLIFLIWITTILVYIYVRVRQEGDPSYVSAEDLSSYTGVKVFSIILAAAYFLWLFFYLVGTIRNLKSLLKPYRFLVGVTLVTIFMTVFGLASGHIAPSQTAAWPLALYSGLYNSYVFLLAWCYTPVGEQYAGISSQERGAGVELRGAEDSAGMDDDEYM